jgi:hypothetical protein
VGFFWKQLMREIEPKWEEIMSFLLNPIQKTIISVSALSFMFSTWFTHADGMSIKSFPLVPAPL